MMNEDARPKWNLPSDTARKLAWIGAVMQILKLTAPPSAHSIVHSSEYGLAQLVIVAGAFVTAYTWKIAIRLVISSVLMVAFLTSLLALLNPALAMFKTSGLNAFIPILELGLKFFIDQLRAIAQAVWLPVLDGAIARLCLDVFRNLKSRRP